MKIAVVAVALVGCTKAEPSAPVGPIGPSELVPTFQPVDAAVAQADAAPTNSSVLDHEWLALAGADLVMSPLAGPFASLELVCERLDRKGDDCQIPDRTGIDRPEPLEKHPTILDFTELRTYQDLGPNPPDHTLDQRRYLAFRTAAGWWVTGSIEGPGGGRGGFGASIEVIGGKVVVGYELTKASSGKWAGTYFYGVAICTDDQGMKCTPRIPTGETGYSTTARECPGCIEEPAFTCVSSFANDALTIAPTPPSKPDGPWSKDAAAACSKLAYAGVGSSRVDLQACKLEYSIVSPK